MRLVLLLPAALIFLATATAGADEADPAQRRARLLESAAKAQAEGNHVKALADAMDAAAIKRTGSLSRFIAEELVDLGRTADAFMAAEECLALAQSEPPSPNHDAVLLGCRALRQDLRAKVALIAIVPPSPPPSGLRVSIQGGPAREPPPGRIAVLPGSLRVEATAEGFAPFQWMSQVGPGTDVDVALAMKPLTAAPPPDKPAVVLPPPAITTDAPPRSIVPFVVAGAGAVLALGGGALYLVANGRYDDLRTTCTQGICPSDAEERRSSIDTLDTLARIGAIAGGVLIVTGGVLWLLDARKAPPRTGLRVGPSFIGYAATF